MIAASELERHMLTLINAERQATGADPLALETNLNQSAEDHSKWMLEADRFSHSGEGGSSPTERIVEASFDLSGSWRTAENIAIRSEQGDNGYLDEVEALHEGLMDSPGHRANLLNPDLKYIGIGVEIGDFNFGGGETESVVVTQNFANTQGVVDLDAVGPAEPDVGEEPEEETPDEETPDEPVPDEGTPNDDVPDDSGSNDEEPGDQQGEEEPDDPSPDEETPDEGEPDGEAPDDGPANDPEMADCEIPDTIIPDGARLEFAQWLIDALTPILAVIEKLDPTFDLGEFDFARGGVTGDEPEWSLWPDADAPCLEDADSDDQEPQPDLVQSGDGMNFDMTTCDAFWFCDAA